MILIKCGGVKISKGWKTVRVFISSTFKDMQAERDHLVRFVFPRLREDLIKYRIHLVDVDLRWGVTSDQNAYDVCMEEIDNCKPHFICILGGRYGWIPSKSYISITASEIHYGALDILNEPMFRHFYFRDPEITNSVPEEFAEDYREPLGSKSEELLESLKERIMDPQTKGKVLVGPDKIECKSLPYYVYPCRWDKNLNRIVDLESLGNELYADIMNSIEAEFGKYIIEPLNEFEEEKAAMKAFIEEKIEKYVIGSRKKILDELSDFADGKTGKNYTILYGNPGSGKTALLAKFYQEYTNKISNKLIIPHFVGVTANSTDIRLILRRFCYELSRSLESDEEIPEDYNDLLERFYSLLNDINNVKSVVILIDAINQLSSSADRFDFGWLPQKLPENVYIIISTLPGIVLETLENSQLNFEEIELPILEPADSETIIINFLQRYRKKFDSKQKKALMDKKDSNNPLYLLAALEEVRTLGTYEEITQCILDLPERVRPLFQWILKRLEEDQGFKDSNGVLIGERLVSDFVSLISISRHGLSQKELTELIDPEDPQGNIAALQRLLSPYLMFKGDLIDFYHVQLLEAVEYEYLSDEDNKLGFHKKLAKYFHTKANPENNAYWNKNYPHALSELSYHQTFGKMWGELEETLCDLNFIEAKCAVGMTYNLIEDYNLALDLHPDAQEKKQEKLQYEKRVYKYVENLIDYCEGKINYLDLIPSVNIWTEEETRKDTERIINNPTSLDNIKAFSQFIDSQSHLLVNFGDLPGFCLQKAYNYSNSGPIHQSGIKILKNYSQKPLVLINKNYLPEYNPHPAQLKTLEGHTDAINAVTVTVDGKKIISGSGSLFNEGDYTVRVWDLETGRQSNKLEGHMGPVNAVTVTADGKKIISGSKDYTIRIWDLETGKQIKTLKGHIGPVNAVTVTADGKKIISGSWDKTVLIWDLETGKQIKTLKGHIGPVNVVTVTADGKKIISGSWDGTIRVWDLGTEKQIKALEGHTDNVVAVTVTADGKKIISGSWDKTVRIWDIESGECLKALEGHTDSVNAVTVTADGKKIISGSKDYTIRIWNLETGKQIKTLKGHTEHVVTVAITVDGKKIISSGSGDKTLRVWDLEKGKQIHKLEGHIEGGKAVIADGKKIISSGIGDKTLRVWDLETGKQLHKLEGYIGTINAVAVTADGKKIISGSGSLFNEGDYTVRVWDLETGRQSHKLEGHTFLVAAIAVTADGKNIISGSWDGTVRVWDLETGKQIHKLEGHTDHVVAVAVTVDGKKVISGSWDGTVRVWDLETGDSVCLYKEKNESINTLAMNNNVSFIFRGGSGHVVLLDLVNMHLGIPIINASRIWLTEENKWDDDIKAKCDFCGKKFIVHDETLNIIRKLEKEYKKLNGWIEDEAWEDPRLITECPYCYQNLKFNLFIVDNKKRNQIGNLIRG